MGGYSALAKECEEPAGPGRSPDRGRGRPQRPRRERGLSEGRRVDGGTPARSMVHVREHDGTARSVRPSTPISSPHWSGEPANPPSTESSDSGASGEAAKPSDAAGRRLSPDN